MEPEEVGVDRGKRGLEPPSFGAVQIELRHATRDSLWAGRRDQLDSKEAYQVRRVRSSITANGQLIPATR